MVDAVVGVLTALPRERLVAIAGLALPGSIGNGLAVAQHDEGRREPALITFLVTPSGVPPCGIGSAFRGVAAGALALAVQSARRRQGLALRPAARERRSGRAIKFCER